MTWLAWRQFRTQAWVAAAAVGVVAVLFGVTGMKIRHLAKVAGYPGCLPANGCRHLVSALQQNGLYTFSYSASLVLVYAVPALIGIFWGAPLVSRELVSGTYRMLWTQSVTRRHWLGTKLVVAALAAALVAGLLSFIVTWWAGPLDTVGISNGISRFTPVAFGARGIAPIGYALFALTLGVAIGLLVRRTVPAMAITLAVFVALQIVTPLWVRPHLQPPVVKVVAVPASRGGFNLGISAPDNRMTIVIDVAPRGSWTITSLTLDSKGKVFAKSAPDVCLGPNFDPCHQYILSQHLQAKVVYQPADRFWPFQVYETAIFLLLSLGLAGLSMWRIKRIG